MAEATAVSFERALETLKALQDAGQLFVRVIPPLYVEFEFDAESVAQIDNSLGFDDFKRATERVEVLLTGVLFDRLDSAIEQELRRIGPDVENADEQRETLKSQAGLVEEKFVDKLLKARADVKSSSKAAAFASLDWDIKVKIADASLEEVNFPYSTLRFNFQREFGAEPFAVVAGRLFDSAQINFTADEIDYTIRVLSKVLARLREEERKSLE